MPAMTPKARAEADILRHGDLVEVPTINKLPYRPQPLGIVGHVHRFVELVVGGLHAEEIEFDDDARVRQAKQAFVIEDCPVDVADNEIILQKGCHENSREQNQCNPTKHIWVLKRSKGSTNVVTHQPIPICRT